MGRTVEQKRRSSTLVGQVRSREVAWSLKRPRPFRSPVHPNRPMPISDVLIKISHSDDGRTRASTSSKWEPVIGYSRAVRAGNLIAVTGTLGINLDGTYPQTAAEQTRRALQIIEDSLEALGAKLSHVVRTRMFVTD